MAFKDTFYCIDEIDSKHSNIETKTVMSEFGIWRLESGPESGLHRIWIGAWTKFGYFGWISLTEYQSVKKMNISDP